MLFYRVDESYILLSSVENIKILHIARNNNAVVIFHKYQHE